MNIMYRTVRSPFGMQVVRSHPYVEPTALESTRPEYEVQHPLNLLLDKPPGGGLFSWRRLMEIPGLAAPAVSGRVWLSISSVPDDDTGGRSWKRSSLDNG